jgi:RPA family protein
MAQIKRETASICQISDINKGGFVKAEGWNPSYFTTELGNISRVNILGFVVSKDQEGLLFDDGSGSIKIRSFEENSFNNVNVGDCLILIGRPRMYNEQKYILPEIMKKADPAWIEFRKLQVELVKNISKPRMLQPNEVKPAHPENTQTPNTNIGNQFQKIVGFIKDLDDGNGAPVDEVIKRTNLKNADELIKKLIEEGEIFEIRPGQLKVLE